MAKTTSSSAGSGNFYRLGQQMGPGALDTGTADILTGIGSELNKYGNALATEKKAEEKELKEKRTKAGEKISNAFVDMGPMLKNLGQESYTQAQNEVEALRYQMYEAIDAKDEKRKADLMIQLNEVKARHEGDSESLKTLVETWEADPEDGSYPVSTDAMSKDDLAVMENFVGNESKRVVYSNDQPPKMMYEWEVPVMDDMTGEPSVDEYGEPILETKSYSIEDLQNKIILKDTVNGTKMLDYGQELKESFAEAPDKAPDPATIKTKVGEIIPKDANQIRDWLHGNPAEQPGLDVHSYLIDLVDDNFNTFEKLGVDISQFEDTNEDGVVDSDDVPRQFKDELISNIMNVKDLQLSHDIITEVYAKYLQYDMIGEPNKDYRPAEDLSILGSNIDVSANAKTKRTDTLTKLKSLNDPDSEIFEEIKGMSPELIAKHLGFKSINSKIYNDDTGQLESISNYIGSAKGVKGENTDADDLIEKYS